MSEEKFRKDLSKKNKLEKDKYRSKKKTRLPKKQKTKINIRNSLVQAVMVPKDRLRGSNKQKYSEALSIARRHSGMTKFFLKKEETKNFYRFTVNNSLIFDKSSYSSLKFPKGVTVAYAIPRQGLINLPMIPKKVKFSKNTRKQYNTTILFAGGTIADVKKSDYERIKERGYIQLRYLIKMATRDRILLGKLG